MISTRGKWIVGVGAALVVLFVLAVRNGSQTPQQRIDKIERACDQQYGPGSDASKRCQIAIMATKLQADDQRRMREAQRQSGF